MIADLNRELMRSGRIERACAAHADKPRPRIMLLRHAYVGADEADVVQGAREISRFYCHFAAWFKNERPISQGLIEPLSEAEMAEMPMFSPELMRTNNVIGEPDEVIARLQHYRALGYDEFALWLDSGMSFERKCASLRRFITQVMPALA